MRFLKSDPPPAHAPALAAATELVEWQGRLNNAAEALIAARAQAFACKLDRDAVDASEATGEALHIADGLVTGKNEQERKAHLHLRLINNDMYPHYAQVRRAAAQAQLDADAAEIRFKVALAQLRAATVAVGAVGVSE